MATKKNNNINIVIHKWMMRKNKKVKPKQSIINIVKKKKIKQNKELVK